MKIVAPVSSISEVEMVLYNGADELYCGFSPPEWRKRFGDDLWMNRRHPDGAGFNSLEELKEAVAQAHQGQVPVYLTLNAPVYPGDTLPTVVEFMHRWASDLKIDGFIISDINLLLTLAEDRLPATIHLSSLGGCFNQHSVGFYHSRGVQRIILSRNWRQSELKLLIEKTRHCMEFEVFALNDGCYFEEAFCQTSHTYGPICLQLDKLKLSSSSRLNIDEKQFAEQSSELQKYLWFQNNCGSSFQDSGLPNGPCSLCWFRDFQEWGVAAVKIVGREASFHRKMASLQLTKAIMDLVRDGVDSEQLKQSARTFRSTPEYCNSGYMCYYRGQ